MELLDGDKQQPEKKPKGRPHRQALAGGPGAHVLAWWGGGRRGAAPRARVISSYLQYSVRITCLPIVGQPSLAVNPHILHAHALKERSQQSYPELIATSESTE